MGNVMWKVEKDEGHNNYYDCIEHVTLILLLHHDMYENDAPTK